MTLRRRPRSAALMRIGYRFAWRALKAWAFVRRPPIHGVMVLLYDDAGRVLLVRHPYGDRRGWELPGGRVNHGESAVEAARRETREEVGADIADLRPRGVVRGLWHFKREQLSFFSAPWPGGRPLVDPVEIAEAAWFYPESAPARLGVGTRAVLAEVLRERD